MLSLKRGTASHVDAGIRKIGWAHGGPAHEREKPCRMFPSWIRRLVFGNAGMEMVGNEDIATAGNQWCSFTVSRLIDTLSHSTAGSSASNSDLFLRPKKYNRVGPHEQDVAGVYDSVEGRHGTAATYGVRVVCSNKAGAGAEDSLGSCSVGCQGGRFTALEIFGQGARCNSVILTRRGSTQYERYASRCHPGSPPPFQARNHEIDIKGCRRK